ncbi:conserved hypothetical protein [Ricinus communis]|uniref:DUF599 domain-containing protein n=2 Tax=Ricinus communis TaxID=3988 RepID=B9SRT3_RICCO|nr:conserved hypothetical protein [Ricinus communis]
MVGYHVYLWQCFKNKPSQTTIGIDSLRRKSWFLEVKEGDDKKSMLAVQSLRNAQMTTIFTASIAILVNLSLAALTNNSYNAGHLLSSAVFGSQSGKLSVLKFGSASFFLLASFLCSSIGLGFMIDSNFLINIASYEFSSWPAYTQTIFERGFFLALIGNRVLCITFPLLLWLLGPLPVGLSSVALVWGLYEFDFHGKSVTSSSNNATALR